MKWLILTATIGLHSPQSSAAESLRLVEGGPGAPSSWIAFRPQGAWICWRSPASTGEPEQTSCWEEVRFSLVRQPMVIDDDGAKEEENEATKTPLAIGWNDMHGWRAGFVDGDRAIFLAPSGQAWLVERTPGHRSTPRPVEPPADLRLPAPRYATCSSQGGWLPYLEGGAWRWRFVRCARPSQTVAKIRRTMPLWLPRAAMVVEHATTLRGPNHSSDQESTQRHQRADAWQVGITLRWESQRIWSRLRSNDSPVDDNPTVESSVP